MKKRYLFEGDLWQQLDSEMSHFGVRNLWSKAKFLSFIQIVDFDENDEEYKIAVKELGVNFKIKADDICFYDKEAIEREIHRGQSHE